MLGVPVFQLGRASGRAGGLVACLKAVPCHRPSYIHTVYTGPRAIYAPSKCSTPLLSSGSSRSSLSLSADVAVSFALIPKDIPGGEWASQTLNSFLALRSPLPRPLNMDQVPPTYSFASNHIYPAFCSGLMLFGLCRFNPLPFHFQCAKISLDKATGTACNVASEQSSPCMSCPARLLGPF